MKSHLLCTRFRIDLLPSQCLLALVSVFNNNTRNVANNRNFVPRFAMKSCEFEGLPKTMKIDTPVFRSVFTAELQHLKEVCERNQMEIRIAGGAVRDIIMGLHPQDIDFATTTLPEQMKTIFNKEYIRILEYGSRAIGHGTIAVRINDKVNYEITTTRSDVLTNGRHAEVVFHEDWYADANRRDLTINSMFLGLDGTLYDYFNGYNDVMNKRVLFVGDAEARIREDYLRIMRYFRFYGRIKALPEDHDANTLQVIARTAEGLAGVAGERIWVELKKIIRGHFADHQIQHIIELGIADQIGLPSNSDSKRFADVYERAQHLEPAEVTLLASLLLTVDQVDLFHARLKFSTLEYSTMVFIVKNRDGYQAGMVKFYQDMVVDSSEKKLTLAHCIELSKYMNDAVVCNALKDWAIPKFPFSAKLLIDCGFQKGKGIAQAIEKVKEEWKRSNFALSADELNDYARKLIDEREITP